MRKPLIAPRAVTALAGVLALAACRANYAPHQPITGVDRPYSDTPDTSVSGDPVTDLLGSFMADLLAERELAENDPSFAVFPAFSKNRDVGPSVNGMGAFLADATTRAIEQGVPNALVFTGDKLLGELQRRGIDPGSLCTTDDVLQAAPQLEVSYLIHGEVTHTTEDALEGRHSVSVRWSCLRIEDGRLTAMVDEPELRGNAAAALIGYMARPTNWNICTR